MTSVPMQRASAQSHPMQAWARLMLMADLWAQYEYAQQRHLREDDPPRNASTPRRRSHVALASPRSRLRRPQMNQLSARAVAVQAYYSETDTDDEPTIRPTNSCGNSETQSLYSNDGANDDDEGAPVSEEDIARRLLRSRPTHRRWIPQARA